MADSAVAAPLTLEEKKAAARARAAAAREAQAHGVAQIQISPAAADYVRRSADALARPHAIRLRVLAGGCAGMEYKLDLLETEDDPRPDEREILSNGIRLLLDTKSAIHVTGSTIDYEESLLKRGFKIVNPNATTSCSCGESFSVAGRG